MSTAAAKRRPPPVAGTRMKEYVNGSTGYVQRATEHNRNATGCMQKIASKGLKVKRSRGHVQQRNHALRSENPPLTSPALRFQGLVVFQVIESHGEAGAEASPAADASGNTAPNHGRHKRQRPPDVEKTSESRSPSMATETESTP